MRSRQVVLTYRGAAVQKFTDGFNALADLGRTSRRPFLEEAFESEDEVTTGRVGLQ